MFNIDTLKKQIKDLAFQIEAGANDVDDTIKKARKKLRRGIREMISNWDLEELKVFAQSYPQLTDIDDFEKLRESLSTALYNEHVVLFDCPEPVNAEYALREVANATAHVAQVKGIRFFHDLLMKNATAFVEKGDLASLTELVQYMPHLRTQVVELRSNYSVTDGSIGGNGRHLYFREGFVENVLVQLQCLDYAIEFLDQEKERLEGAEKRAA